MPQTAKTFRIFVSSTFGDLKAQRDEMDWQTLRGRESGWAFGDVTGRQVARVADRVCHEMPWVRLL